MVCAAGAIAQVPGTLLPSVQLHGWDAYVLATDQAMVSFPQVMAEIVTASKRPVRTDFHTTTGYSLPDPDVVLVMPATFNTIVKMAAGTADSYVLTRLAEQIGRRTPLAVVPQVNHDFTAHPAYAESATRLRSWGVEFLDDDESIDR